jgi:hypothetical protein
LVSRKVTPFLIFCLAKHTALSVRRHGWKMLESLPGVNVQTDGALGLYEFGNSVTVRAFNLQQIDFVLDGVPMGRLDAFGGSPIFRDVDNENLARWSHRPGRVTFRRRAMPRLARSCPTIQRTRQTMAAA